MTRLRHTLGALTLTLLVSVAQAREIRVAVVTDGPAARTVFSAASIEKELANVAAPDTQVVLPEAKRYVGDWSLAGAEAALDRAFADRDVDVVLTIGILTSQQAARRKSLPKPTIAPLVIDPVLQGFPLLEGRSARHNFAYVADFHSVANEVRAFHEIVGFKYMVALVNDALLAALPALTTKAPELAAELKIRIGIVRAGMTSTHCSPAFPRGSTRCTSRRCDSAMRNCASWRKAAGAQTTHVFRGRAQRGRSRCAHDHGRRRTRHRAAARRVAIMIQRISQGGRSATFEVGFPTSQRLLINMQVARAIGFSPRWQYLADAEQLLTDSGDAQPLTLLGAMRAALDANPALAASRERLGSALDDVNIARSGLLPSLSASAAHAHRRGSRESTDAGRRLHQHRAGIQPGDLLRARLGGLFDCQIAGRGAGAKLSAPTCWTRSRTAAAAYLNVCAPSRSRMRRRNAENTRRNLEISRVREEVGSRGARLSALGVAAGARQADAAVRGSEPSPGRDRVAAHPAPPCEPALPHHGSRHRRSAGAGGESAHAGVSRHSLEVGDFHGIRGAHGAAERARNQGSRSGAHRPTACVEFGRARLLST